MAIIPHKPSTMAITTPEKRTSFVSKWLEGADEIVDETERTSLSSSVSSNLTWLGDDVVPPPPTALKETSACFAAWDMTSTGVLSADEIQAIMIALTANGQSTRYTSDSDSEDEDEPTFLPAMGRHSATVQQLPSVGGAEFIVRLVDGPHKPTTRKLSNEWLTGELTNPESIQRQYSIHPAAPRKEQSHCPKARPASVQTLPEETDGETSYWVTLPNAGAVWRVNNDPDPEPHSVSLQRRRPSSSSSSSRSRLSFFRPTSRMNGKDLSFVVGRAIN